jgi:hypothetical protein
MVCKYCKKTTHLIDDCPEIICKKCKLVGHPFWKCRNILKKNTQTNNPLDESIDNHSNEIQHGELDKNKINETKTHINRTNDDQSYGNRSNGNRSNGNRSNGNRSYGNSSNGNRSAGSRVGESNYYRSEKSSNSASFERKFNEIDDKINSSKMSVINRNLPKAQLPTPVPVEKVEVETKSDTNEDTWANVLVNSDNRISYFYKYKNAKWSELC